MTTPRLAVPRAFRTTSKTSEANALLQRAGRELREAGSLIERQAAQVVSLQKESADIRAERDFMRLAYDMSQAGVIRASEVLVKASEMRSSGRPLDYWQTIHRGENRVSFSSPGLDKESHAAAQSNSPSVAPSAVSEGELRRAAEKALSRYDIPTR